MSYREMKWTCKDGTAMFACEWLPDNREPIPAVVGLVHGMGEHMGRYAHVAEMLNEQNYAVFGFDQRGHGRTEGQRGHAPTYEELLEGVDKMLAEIERQFPGLPVFLFGHSMGGNVTLNYLLRRKPDIAGAIVTGPWLKLSFEPPAFLSFMAKLISKFYPGFAIRRPLNPDSLTSDPAMKQRYMNDRLGHGVISARFFLSMEKAGQWALDHADELSVPLLLMHASDDQVTLNEASRQFADKAKSQVRWISWPGFKHELHNDVGRELVFATIKEWLREHRPTASEARKIAAMPE
jgi:alpha-beta hydrolase superfamily lysophospholipase